MRWRIAGFLVLAGAAIGIACGGSSSDATPSPAAAGTPPAATTPGAQPTAVRQNTVVVISGSVVPTRTATPFPAEQQTAVALGPNVPLVPYDDADGRYTVSVPQGWTEAVAPDGYSASLAGSPLTAVVGILCVKGGSVDALIAGDQSLQKQINAGDMTLEKEKATTVAGVPAREIPWSGYFDLLNLTIDHDWVYFEANGCAWRILLSTYPPAKIDDYMPMFRKLLDSFKLK